MMEILKSHLQWVGAKMFTQKWWNVIFIYIQFIAWMYSYKGQVGACNGLNKCSESPSKSYSKAISSLNHFPLRKVEIHSKKFHVFTGHIFISSKNQESTWMYYLPGYFSHNCSFLMKTPRFLYSVSVLKRGIHRVSPSVVCHKEREVIKGSRPWCNSSVKEVSRRSNNVGKE